MSNFCFLKYIKISFDKYAQIDIGTGAVIIACHSCIICIMIVHTYTQRGLLRHGGGGVPLKTFPVSIMFNEKIRLFPPKMAVFVLRNQKANLYSVMGS